MKNKKNKCIKCEHEWHPRKHNIPKYCPCCNSPNWNKKLDKDIINLLIS